MADELGIKLKASLGDYRELIKGISNLEKEIKPIKIADPMLFYNLEP